MDLSSFTNEPTFMDYMDLRVHERSEVGDLARILVSVDNRNERYGPGRTLPRFVVIDELLDFVTQFDREAAAQAWTDYRSYLRKWRSARRPTVSEAA